MKLLTTHYKLLTSSFTLIEMLVVIGALALTLPALFSIIFTLMQQQTKVYRLSEVKRQGDYALAVISNLIKNSAVSTHTGLPPSNEVCTTPGLTSITYFRSKYKDNEWFQLYLNSDRIASSSSIAGASGDLTNTKVRVTGLTIQCNRSNSFSPPIVNISFTVAYNTTSPRAEEQASLTYQTIIKLKSY